MTALPVLFSNTAARSDTTAGGANPGPGWPSMSFTRASNEQSSLAIKGRPNSARPLYLVSAIHTIESQTDLAAIPGEEWRYWYVGDSGRLITPQTRSAVQSGWADTRIERRPIRGDHRVARHPARIEQPGDQTQTRRTPCAQSNQDSPCWPAC